MKYTCDQCGTEGDKKTGHVNRARKIGAKLFCSKVCFGLSRRTTLEDKKAKKSEYDKKFRAENAEKINARNQEYWKQPHVKELWRKQRQKRMPKHVEYCRQPEYKKWKKEYDKTFRAKKNYGEYWEASIALEEISKEIDNREIKLQQNLTNKTQKRKRQWKNSLPTI